MRKEDVIIEAYDLIKGEYAENGEFASADFVCGVVKMSEACISMVETNEDNRY